ncbi:hypothetical protein QQ045_029323 [Rhodiola kirilowii]
MEAPPNSMRIEQSREDSRRYENSLENKGSEEEHGMKRISPWREQITVRGLVASLLIGVLFSVITLKLALTTGLIPNLNVSVALLAFVAVKSWTGLLHKAGIVSTPFTRQENTVVQTCAIACYSMVSWEYGCHCCGAVLYVSFYFDFSLTYVGAGMICPHIVNLSLLIGAVLSYGIMWPLISDLKGEWYPAALSVGSMQSLNGYKVFVSIAIILGDGLYNFLKVIIFTARNLRDQRNQKILKTNPDNQIQSPDEQKRNKLFMRERIPVWVAVVGYGGLSIISIVVIPIMFHELKWYYALVAYMIAPALGFCNAYGAGLTDMNMGYNYGKVALFVLAALSGHEHGVVAGLVGSGLIKTIASMCSDLMHDFKTAQLTHTSPRSMLVSQAIGTAMGCIVAPGMFLLFYNAFNIGNPEGEYKAPYAIIYRNMAIIGVEGFSALPRNCLNLCYGFFALAIVLNLIKDMIPSKVGKWIPLPMAMAVPFLVGANFAIDMGIGSLIVLAWSKVNKSRAKLMVPAVASGFICGDGMWLLPASLLALAKVAPPICMTFLATKKV